MKFKFKNLKVAIIGLGYVGLPLAVEFGKKFNVIGFDTKKERINELRQHVDSTKEVTSKDLKSVTSIHYTDNKDDLKGLNFYIVTVPTPVDGNKKPDLSALISACETVGAFLCKDSYIVFESTVYPGTTEEVCVPILEEFSKLKFNRDFYCGYSPERINPGDKEHRLTNILKVTSGSTKEAANFIDSVYKEIITAGTYKAESIKIAESAKVIENTQRDINIALMNELAIIFNKLNIPTSKVLKAASTKWNFLPFKPGLVGGHCIGVDPYYLTFKAESLGYQPNVILSGRSINDSMGKYVASELIKKMTRNKIVIRDSNVLILGVTFKENCPDIRNTKVVDVIRELNEFGCEVCIYDPWVMKNEMMSEYDLEVMDSIPDKKYDAAIIATPHQIFIEKGPKFYKSLLTRNGIFFDLKSVFETEYSDMQL